MMAERTYRICTRCVMDTSAANISFNSEGVCNYCIEFLNRSKNTLFMTEVERARKLNDFVAKVKADGRGKPYDCIVGISGGADSAYSLYLAKKEGLRPLAVHMDNGWDSELAASNIENLICKMGVDLYTHVIDWNEYKSLMQAFFDADVIDVELLYDNAMLAVNYQLAAKYGLKWILAGTNEATEGMLLPTNWNWFKRDKKNIRSLAATRAVKIRTFPLLGTLDFIYYEFVRKAKWVSFLDFVDYNKNRCIELLQNQFGFRPYPHKHYESIFTRFYQGYILPNKFRVDKRKVHLSTLIICGQLKRDAAIAILAESPYPSEQALKEDIDYFLKKMGWSKKQLEDYLARPEQTHARYGTEKPLWDFCLGVYRKISD